MQIQLIHRQQATLTTIVCEPAHSTINQTSAASDSYNYSMWTNSRYHKSNVSSRPLLHFPRKSKLRDVRMWWIQKSTLTIIVWAALQPNKTSEWATYCPYDYRLSHNQTNRLRVQQQNDFQQQHFICNYFHQKDVHIHSTWTAAQSISQSNK